ncbi:MFS transporter [Chloroflexi bacterium TSY]|nr:MFS transporter [Chloroflexi bacterium TSY]
MSSSTTPNQKISQHWFPIGALSTAFAVDQSEQMALSVLWPQMYRSLGVSVGQLGVVSGLAELVFTVTLPLWGYAADRFSRKWLLVFFAGVWGLWTAAIGLIDTLPQLMIVRVLTALGLGAFGPTVFSLVGDLFENKTRGRVLSLMEAFGMVGILFAFGALPVLAESSPEAWRQGFLLLGGASFVSALLMLRLKEPPRGAAEPELHDVVSGDIVHRTTFKWRDLQELFKIRSWWWLLIKEILDGMSLLVFFRWAFPWLDELGLGPAAVPVIVYIFVSLIIGQLIAGWLGDSLEHRFPSKGRLMLVWVGMMILVPGAFFAFSASGDSIVWLLIPVTFFSMGFSASSVGVRWPIAQAVLPPELRGSGQAFALMASGIVAAVMLVLSGWVVDQVGSIASMLLLLFPVPVFVALFAWLPLFRTYASDREALHRRLTQQRADLLDAPV